MGLRTLLVVCFGMLAGATLGAIGTGIWLIESGLPRETAADLRDLVIIYGGATAFVLLAIIAVTWAYLDHALGQPLSAVVRGIQTVVHAKSDYRIEIEEAHQLDGLPGAVNELIRELGLARTSLNEAIDKATISIESQKNQLATILMDLHEGVIVCTLNHRILLYNKRALELLRMTGDIGLDRSLFRFLTQQPILHALSRLTNRLAQGRYDNSLSGHTVAFVGSTADGKHTLEGRMSLIVEGGQTPTGYVVSFDDHTDELAALALRDRLLREATEGLRQPVGNLRAAAEILAGGGALSVDEEADFKRVLLQESQQLGARLERLAAQYRHVITGHWPMSDIFSSNLLQTLADRLREQNSITASIAGLPLWLHGDSYSLIEFLYRVMIRLSAFAATASFQLEAVTGENRVYIDVIWSGPVLPAAELDGWLDDKLEDALGGLSLKEILERHKTDIWSLPDRPGQARLRLPLPPSARPVIVQNRDSRPSRPEFYDFDLLRRPLKLGELGQRSLKSLTYVVFDTETTGLDPSGGDEIVAIAGVRIVNGRILTGESFERTVNPRRYIPKESIRFHGITEQMVKDKPPIEVVLPQFRAFIGDAVLVGHNAAFDLKFLKMREAESGVGFDMVVLDTLLLSCFLHDYTSRHGLEVVAHRFGIPVQGRHTALGDSLVTAGCFLKMLDFLETQGVTTLEQALAVSDRVLQLKIKQAGF